MKINSIIDYWGCILIKLFGPLIRILPVGFGLFLGRRLGDALYYFDFKHKAVAYANIRTALGENLSPLQLSRLARKSYQAFGQNMFEVFYIPLVDKKYIDKYISISGMEYLLEGFRRGNGVILVSVHAGSWELSNIICAQLGLPFLLFVREQRYPRLDKLLNSYRLQQGCKIIPRKNGLRQLIQILSNNQAVGMTVDQGSDSGTQVKFLGKDASMSSGALRLALKYGATIIPVFYVRVKGRFIKVFLDRPFEIKKSANPEHDITENLQALVCIFDKYILKYPQEYLWSYRIWKRGKEKNILILSDGKAGHLRQSQAVAAITAEYLRGRGGKAKVDICQIETRSVFAKAAIILSSCLAGKYHCQGCLWCLKTFLKEDTYKSLASLKPDMIISSGSTLAPINFVLSRETLAKSVVVMRPSLLGMHRFNLVIMPRHDHPPKKKNLVAIDGALNLIDDEYLKAQSERLFQGTGDRGQGTDKFIGLLIGGDTKKFRLNKDVVSEVIKQIKFAADKLGTGILVTTSRRTSADIEKLVKREFAGYARCRLLVIANEKNIPEAVGGILGLSQVVVTSPESISMISEAASSKKYVLVFESLGLSQKHMQFIKHLAKNSYIYLIGASDIGQTIDDVWRNKPPIFTLKDNLAVGEAIRKII